jgi:hypothetical protein
MTRGRLERVQDGSGTMRQAHLVSLINLNIAFPMRRVLSLEEGGRFFGLSISHYLL